MTYLPNPKIDNAPYLSSAVLKTCTKMAKNGEKTPFCVIAVLFRNKMS